MVPAGCVSKFTSRLRQGSGKGVGKDMPIPEDGDDEVLLSELVSTGVHVLVVGWVVWARKRRTAVTIAKT